MGFEPSEIPCYEDADERDAAYERAEREGTPFFAVERYDEGYAVTYDLLPAGWELSKPARKELDERLTRELEAVVGDESIPTSEVSKSVGDSLGNISLFERKRTARRVAAVAARIALDESNWVEASPPEDATGAEFRRN
ncbi:hypothetical protein C475_08121 [Halosimplex carlsbadense 2-9-1]|uniref:Uncharacterized protein n=1 Tax=Halosimplex carlsbadense 2-9-1 TaxID=797114 RepID=M0CUF9_9EURY|nr:hypothetical protein C475_08121 [Halosimplex carlsbadense 2-9-1]